MGYSLECGNSWNHKIPRYPKTLKSLVKALDDSAYECNRYYDSYYESSKEDWSNVAIDPENASIATATVLYYSEVDPKKSNTHWHYSDGKITIWANWSDFPSPVIPLFEHSKA